MKTTLALSGAALLIVCAASAQSFSIDWFTIDGGGGTSSGGSYSVSGTIGQPDTGKSAGGNFEMEAGFWSVFPAVQTPGAPFLKVKRVGNTVEISWSTTDTAGFVLQETDSLASPSSWSGVVTTPTVVINENVVTVTASAGFHFYRLRKP